MYDSSGAWTYDIGLPSKSGVGGGIVAVLPGKSAIAVFSPRLDSYGNSVRGIKVCQSFSSELGLHVFNSDRLSSDAVIRSSYTIDEVPSKRIRSKKAGGILSSQGKHARVYELAGELGFSATEVILSRVENDLEKHDIVILSLCRVTSIDQAATQLIARMARILNLKNKRLILSDTHPHDSFLKLLDNTLLSLDDGLSVQAFDDIDHATEWCENHYLTKSGYPKEIIRTTYLSQQELLSGLKSSELDFLASIGEEKNYKKGDYLCRAGDTSNNLYFILSGYVSIAIPLDSKRQQRLATLDAGSAFGEFSVVDKRPRSANSIANTAVKCLVVDFEKIEEDPSEHARNIRTTIIENMARNLVDRLRKANTEIHALSV
jgi:glutaminase